METTDMNTPTDQDKFVRGLYRNIGELARNVKLLAIALERSFGPIKVEVKDATTAPVAAPTQATLDLEPGSIAREIAAKPRTWCNAVKVWEWLADKYTVFSLCDMARDVGEISRITNGRISAASYSRIVSTLKRAGAILKTTRNTYMPLKPTDELREAVERVAKKRKEVAA